MKRKSLVALATGLALSAIGLGATASRADAATWQQPYGGCVEGHNYPHSQGAAECRAHGWTVRQRLVVGPHDRVRFVSLPLCREEDGSGQRSACTWNFGPGPEGLYHPHGHTGDDRGLSFWVDRKDRVHYVWNWTAGDPRPDGWKWVSSELGDALAEGEQHEDNWEGCITNGVHHHRIRVACPDGFGLSA